MSEFEFLFALDLSDEASFDRMLGEIADAIFVHLGLARPAVDALLVDVRRELASGGTRPCELRFLVRGGQLEVAVSHDGAAPWRTQRALA